MELVRVVGDDPNFILSLCTQHRHARHDGLFKITFRDGQATFALADGEVLGTVDLRVLAPAGGDPRVSPAQRASVADARKALMKLELSAREADRLIAAAGPCETTERLVLEALRRRPVSV